MQITPISPGLFSVEKEGVRQLGIAVGPSKNSLLGTFGKFKDSYGFVVPSDGTALRPWNIVGFVAFEQTLIAYGPWIAGPHSFADIYELPPGEGLQKLVMLARVAEILDREAKLPQNGLNLEGYVHFEDGTILVLPTALQEIMRAGKNIVERFLPYDALHNPALRGAASWAFSLSLLAFRLKCGVFPYETGSEPEEWSSRIVTKALETPRCRFPDAPEALENAYWSFLVYQEFSPGVLSVLPSILSLWLEPGSFNQATDGTIGIDRSVNKAQKALTRRLRRYRRRRFYRHNRLWIGVSATALVIGCIIVGSIVGQYFRSPLTAGMSPEEVVKTFYNAYNTFDSAFMEDATRNKIAQDQVGEISNLFIIDRVRSASENRKVHFTPQEWIKAGKPGVEYSLMIFGIDELSITLHDVDIVQGNAHASADYMLYSNISDQEDTDQPALPKNVRITHKHQELTLKKDDRGNWTIVAIQDLPIS